MAADDWHRNQVVLLTGATGTLGGCLLYKLAVQIPTRKVFVLCRGSVRQAVDKLERSMPDELPDILDTQRVEFLLGDMAMPNLGLSDRDLRRAQCEATVIINCAASVSLRQGLQSSVEDNCRTVAFLLDLLPTFSHPVTLLHVSSAFVNTFLPDGAVLERIYPLACEGTGEIDPRAEMQKILDGSHAAYEDCFHAPYQLAKYLAERLVLGYQHAGRTLVVRPSNIGPAILHPFPFYGSDMTIPLHSYFQFLLRNDEVGLERLGRVMPLHHIIDEIPVDLAASACLLHLVSGSTGIVHAAADLYRPYTAGQIMAHCYAHVPLALRDEICTRGGAVLDRDLAEHFFRIFAKSSRGWLFDCSKSALLKGRFQGPLGLDLPNHDPDDFLATRLNRLAQRMKRMLDDSSKTFSEPN